MYIKIFFIIIMSLSVNSLSIASDDHHEDEHHHGAGKSIGEGKAITEVDEEKGFKLSKEAIEALGLKMIVVKNSTFDIPKTSIVTSTNTIGVYRYKQKFFKLLSVKIIKENADTFTIKVDLIIAGDTIVTQGVGPLRVADIYSTDTSEYGHAH